MPRLHPPDPHPHAEAAQLQINGLEIPLQCRTLVEVFLLSGKFQTSPNYAKHGAFAEIELKTPVKTGQGDFRSLGIALQEIRNVIE